MRRALVALLAAAALSAGGASATQADVFGSFSLASASPYGQAEFAHDPVISENGEYVVFDGSVAGVKGVWRRRVAAGSEFEQVAGGDATLPSVSADGRYVSFTTNQGGSLGLLSDGQMHDESVLPLEAPSVYVRDMSKGLAFNPGTERTEPEAGAFTLVSAKDHSQQSLTYEFPGVEEGSKLELDRRRYGAVAAGRSAITADGRTVVFVTTAQSDLDGPGTPPLQVVVRHLDSEETKLVSVKYDPATRRAAISSSTGEPEPVPLEVEEGGNSFGAIWVLRHSAYPEFSAAENGVVTQKYSVTPLPGAAISADGSTVAWMGEMVSEQTASLSGEQHSKLFAEPLWRRIDGPADEPTRQVAGPSDPESPACRASPEAEVPQFPVSGDPCQGAFAEVGSSAGLWHEAIVPEATYVPKLSANGDEVAFIATAEPIADAGEYGLPAGGLNSDVFAMDMTAPSQLAGFRQLTQFASGDVTKLATNSNIADFTISPDGSQVAFSTRRTVFPLGEPAYISAPTAVPGLVELFDADLSNNTLTRVTTGYEGGPPSHPEVERGVEARYQQLDDGSLSPSFSATGLLAFSSTASNLVFGDGNTPSDAGGRVDGADVFVVPRITFSTEPTPQSISPAPTNPEPVPPWKLLVTASSASNGIVKIRAVLPGAGILSARATSSVPTRAAKQSRRSVKRKVAGATATVAPGSSAAVVLTLRLGSRYGSLATRQGGLRGVVELTFTASGHSALRRTLSVRFVRKHAAKRAMKAGR